MRDTADHAETGLPSEKYGANMMKTDFRDAAGSVVVMDAAEQNCFQRTTFTSTDLKGWSCPGRRIDSLRFIRQFPEREIICFLRRMDCEHTCPHQADEQSRCPAVGDIDEIGVLVHRNPITGFEVDEEASFSFTDDDADGASFSRLMEENFHHLSARLNAVFSNADVGLWFWIIVFDEKMRFVRGIGDFDADHVAALYAENRDLMLERGIGQFVRSLEDEFQFAFFRIDADDRRVIVHAENNYTTGGVCKGDHFPGDFFGSGDFPLELHVESFA